MKKIKLYSIIGKDGSSRLVQANSKTEAMKRAKSGQFISQSPRALTNDEMAAKGLAFVLRMEGVAP